MSGDHHLLQPSCPAVNRTERLFDPAAAVHGLRAAQSRLDGGLRTLAVWLFRDPPAELAVPGPWTLSPSPGGAPVTVTAAALVATPSPHVELTVTGEPDQGRYRLVVEPPAGVEFDPLRNWLAVRLRPECPDLGACSTAPQPTREPQPSPLHDYLARDWHSLRAVLVESLLRERPDADLSVADPTISMIELFAHVGDLLNYRLDRVATEAYLETARLRTSVRRHARLVDFELGEAVSARTFVHVSVPPGAGTVALAAGEVAVDAPGSATAFTLESGLDASDALGEIAIHDWGEAACCLPRGATECVLVRPAPADPLGAGWLSEGDLIAFEVIDPRDREAHARWARREQAWPIEAPDPGFRAPLASRAAQVVRLTAVEPFADPLLGAALELTRVRWPEDEALARDYPIGIDSEAGADEVTVARGNLVRAHHGRPVDGPPEQTLRPVPSPAGGGPAEFLMTAAGTPPRRGRPGGPGLACDEHGQPYGIAVTVNLPSGIPVGADRVRTLADQQAASDFAFTVDVEDHEPPTLRFRTGAVGVPPPLGSSVSARYEVGGGRCGNVAANTLTLLERNPAPAGQAPQWEEHLDATSGRALTVRNPVAAWGGADPIALAVARRDAPEAFAADLDRAVVAADYAEVAAASPPVARASATRTWSGSWPLISAVVDLDARPAAARLAALGELSSTLDGARMVGTEAAAIEGTPVGFFLSLAVCAAPGARAEAVRAAALQALRPGSEEHPGLFHPSRLDLGAAVYVSGAIAAVAAIPGVDAVDLREARRRGDPPGTVREVITVGAGEVAVLDDDPARPERGRLDIVVRGGR